LAIALNFPLLLTTSLGLANIVRANLAAR